MNGQELATAVQYGAKSIIVLLNNGMFGTIRMHQEREYPQHVAGTRLAQPGLCRLGACLRLLRCVTIRKSADFEAESLQGLRGPTAQ